MKLIFRTLLYVFGVALFSGFLAFIAYLLKYKLYNFQTQDAITIGLLLLFTACVYYFYEKIRETKQDQKKNSNIYIFFGFVVAILPNCLLSEHSILSDFLVALIEITLFIILIAIVLFTYKKCKILIQKIIQKFFQREEVK